MKDIIRLIGVIFVVAGILFAFRPDLPRRLMQFFKKGSRIYLAGAARLTLAVVFLVGAENCRHKWVIVGFGILFMISGLIIFALGAAKLRGLIDWFAKLPALVLRGLGVSASVLGAIICYCA